MARWRREAKAQKRAMKRMLHDLQRAAGRDLALWYASLNRLPLWPRLWVAVRVAVGRLR